MKRCVAEGKRDGDCFDGCLQLLEVSCCEVLFLLRVPLLERVPTAVFDFDFSSDELARVQSEKDHHAFLTFFFSIFESMPFRAIDATRGTVVLVYIRRLMGQHQKECRLLARSCCTVDVCIS